LGSLPLEGKVLSVCEADEVLAVAEVDRENRKSKTFGREVTAAPLPSECEAPAEIFGIRQKGGHSPTLRADCAEGLSFLSAG